METYAKKAVKNIGNLERFQKVFRRARQGEHITVGFIGGSITMGSLSSTPKTCYAYLVKSWFQDTYPDSHVRYVNAGIGATTSQFGVARVIEDLLCHNPDVVIAEFSVNDEANDFFEETFEGLIRKILYAPGKPALLMFDNVKYDTGENAAVIHDKIGCYYDLPIVDMKEGIYQAILDGAINREEITPDNLHPNDKGHRLVADMLTSLLARISENTDLFPVIKKKSPLTKNRYEQSVRLQNQTLKAELNGFRKDDTVQNGITDIFKHGYTGRRKGDSLMVGVTCRYLAIQYKKTIHKPAPIARLVVDGKEENAVLLDANFNEDWGDCLYLETIFTEEEKKEHEITVTIVSDQEAVSDFYLTSIVTA